MNEKGISDDVRYIPRIQADGKFVILDRAIGQDIADDHGYVIRFTKASVIEICRRLNAD